MTLHMPPPKLALSSDAERNLPSASVSSSQDTSTAVVIGKQNRGSVLYKTLSPRKKFDKFGLDQTDYKAYCLSATVFPTAVKTTLLGDLHDSNPQACGFDIVERPKVDYTVISSLPSCATSVINAPPPTAVTSQRSIQSAPVVAFVEIPSAEMMNASTRHPSAVTGGTKSSANSIVFSDTVSGHHGDQQQQNIQNGGKDRGYTNNIEHMLSHNGVTSKDERGDRTGASTKNSRNRSESGPRSSWSSVNGNSLMDGGNDQFTKKRSDLPAKSVGKKQTPRTVASFSRLDESRLICYQWKSREIRQEEEKKDGGDIRDTMYLNTFFPEERPVRFNKISLPRINRPFRQRPWTVSESKFSARASMAMMTKINDNVSSRQDKTPAIQQSHQTALRGVLKHGGGLSGGVSKSAGHIKLRQQRQQQHAWREQAVIEANKNHNYNNDNDDNDDDGDKENDDNGSLTTKPLLEIRSFLSANSLGDQRDKLKGKNGCLNSRVKQCVRFVRYRERLDKQEDNRPLKSEHGKYRPFSKTNVRDHNPSNPAPTPELKLQQSVESYQQYVDNIARQTNLSSPKPNFSFRSGGGGGNNGSNPTSGFSRLRAPPKINGAGTNLDTIDSMLVQSVMDSNRPEGVNINNNTARNSSDTPRPQNSAIYTKDVSDMGQALDIKRISPVPTVNRVVPGTRGVIQRTNSPRGNEDGGVSGAGMANADADGECENEGHSVTHHGDTIVVPQASKLDCVSEYSVTKDD